eukprot:5356569-Pyramimonas_sp.AAC.1
MDLERGAEAVITGGDDLDPPGTPNARLPEGTGADASVAPSPHAANLTEETGLQPGGRERETGEP